MKNLLINAIVLLIYFSNDGITRPLFGENSVNAQTTVDQTIHVNAPTPTRTYTPTITATFTRAPYKTPVLGVTPTPIPTLDPNLPSPTAISGNAKVLWLVHPDDFPGSAWPDYEPHSNIFLNYGATSDFHSVIDTKITNELLRDYNVVIFADSNSRKSLTSDESNAIVQFVYKGGSLFVTGDNHKTSTNAESASSLTRPFGIEYGELRISDEISKSIDHELLNDLQFDSRFRIGGNFYFNVVPPAKTLATASGAPVLAIADYGYGRIIVFSNELGDYLQLTGDYHTFIKNAAAWLLNKDNFIGATPTPPHQPYIRWSAEFASYNGIQFTLHGGSLMHQLSEGTTLNNENTIIEGQLPDYPVNINVDIVRGDSFAQIIQQPREYNNYTAIFVIKQKMMSFRMHDIVITWSEKLEVTPTPTPTPIQTWHGPTPTPNNSKKKVLWFAASFYFLDNQAVFERLLDFAKIFTDMGAENTIVEKYRTTITDKLLADYSAVIFAPSFDNTTLPQEERLPISKFIRGGGSVLVMGGDQWNGFTISDQPLFAASVTAPFGIKYSLTTSQDAIDFEQHPIVDGVEYLRLENPSTLIITPPARALAYSTEGDPILAISEVGYGRLIAYGDELAFLTGGKNSENPIGIEFVFHRKFAENVSAWLLRQEKPLPPEATFTPTPPQPDITPLPTVEPTLVASPTPAPPGELVNLLEIYPNNLPDSGDEDSDGNINWGAAREWTFILDDIYRLTEFTYKSKDGYEISTGEADLGVGKTNDGSVLAVLIPRNGGWLQTNFLDEKEEIASIYFRFHPKDVITLFPVGTVYSNGDPNQFNELQRIANFKFYNSYHAGSKAVVQRLHHILLDIDTLAGVRRFVWFQDGVSEYFDRFENRAIAKPEKIPASLRETMFDIVWGGYDESYPMFILRPEVDWDAMREKYLPKVNAAEDTYQFADIIAEMLRPFRDLHIWVNINTLPVSVYSSSAPTNYNLSAFKNYIGEMHKVDDYFQWGQTEPNIGFILIGSWSNDSIPASVDQALEQLKDTDALIVDVRSNGGGSEPLARQVAGRFADQEYIYAYSQYRNGPNHNDLTEKYPRKFSTNGSWQYDKPVILLIGQRCMSSNESFIAMMSMCPQVTLMGDHTRGSSGNPKFINLPFNIQVSMPQWIDYLPDSVTPLDEHGVLPDVWFVPDDANAFKNDRDDLLQSALDRLRITSVKESLKY
ncbi:MAG: S41 family peptidase [Candidatus Omnitrophota bacterium]